MFLAASLIQPKEYPKPLRPISFATATNSSPYLPSHISRKSYCTDYHRKTKPPLYYPSQYKCNKKFLSKKLLHIILKTAI